MTKKQHLHIDRLVKAVSKISSIGGIISGTIFVMMVLLVLAEVFLRFFCGKSTMVAGEYSGYALSAMIYMGLGFSFRQGAHIRITFITDRLSIKASQILEGLALLFATVLCGLSSIFMWDMFLTSKARNLVAYTVAETPLWVPQFIVFIGLCVLTLQIASQLLQMLLCQLKIHVGGDS